MTAAVVVIVLVAGADAPSPAIAAAVSAANEALGAQVALVLRSVARPSDQEALRLAGLTAATAVGTIVWNEPRHDVAQVRVHATDADGWREQTIVFAATDSPQERGRALGLALASMVTPAIELALRERPADAPRWPPAVGRGEPPVTADARATPSEAGAQFLSPADDVPPGLEGRWSAELRALGVRGMGGPGGGWGLAAGVQGPAWRRLRPRVDVAGRAGDIPGLGGQHRAATLAAGAVWQAPALDAAPHLGWAARLQAGVVVHDFSHRTADDALLHAYRLLPAVLAAVEGWWRIGARFELVAGVGTEAALGKTEVVVASTPVATVPAVRVQAELGGRVWF